MKSTQPAHLQQQTKQLEAASTAGSIIRRYAAADHPRIADICKNVCECASAPHTLNPASCAMRLTPAASSAAHTTPPDGGSDVLPRTIQTQLVHNSAATVLVSQPAADQAVNGVGGQ